MKVEASVYISKCNTSGKMWATRVERMGNEWVRTWAFPISEEIAKGEGFDKVSLSGEFPCTDEFQGCPYCGAFGFVKCGACGKLTDDDGETDEFACNWCGNTGTLTTVDTMDFSGGDY
jgi:hypothetical protein